jgi:hypothetical protein
LDVFWVFFFIPLIICNRQPTGFSIGFSFRDVTELFVISSQIHLTSCVGVDLVAVGGRTCLTNTKRLNAACTPYLLD